MSPRLHCRVFWCATHGLLILEVLYLHPDQAPRPVALAIGGRFGYVTMTDRKEN